MGDYKIYKNKNGEFQFILKASNGLVLIKSNVYDNRQSCLNDVLKTRIQLKNISNIIKKTSPNGKYYFIVKSNEGSILATSQLYESEAGRENAIYSLLEFEK